MTAETLDAPLVITEPGVYDMTSVEYHADPVPGGSLSSTGARKLLDTCPALFDYERRNPPAPTKAFDTGNAAHDTLLGGGPEIVVCDYPDWRTKKAQDEAKEHRARGAVPILPAERQEVDAIVAAIRTHPTAGPLFAEGTGRPEASLFWTDERTGINRRARIDWLPHQTSGSRLIVPDLKTCRSAKREEFAKSAMDHGYHQQGPFYLDGIKALGLGEDPVFVFVAVEKKPPYLVNVIQLDVVAMRIGASLNRDAIDIYAECVRTGEWPGYGNEVELASLPYWYERKFEDQL
jgi:hypothetical protein